MCELLGMSANVPTDIRFSFAALARRGGETGPHADGWGIAFYEGRGCRCFHDPEPSARSELAKLLRRYPIKSRIVVAHVRKANRGRVSLENTHPFSRELWGRRWTFAHNGQLKGVKRLKLGRFEPVGTTDSEHAFCWILSQLQERFPKPPRSATLEAAIAEYAQILSERGVFNMLLTDSRALYAHCGKRLCYLTRRAPFGSATLMDEDLTADFSQVTTPGDIVSIVATRPLTRDETWTTMRPGEFVVFRGGVASVSPRMARGRSRMAAA